VSRLRVYDWPTPDGLRGGTPHMHLACSEAYVVVGGAGAVQTLTLADGFNEDRLAPGDLVWFTPGTIHRLINHGDLDIIVLMQNSGLPEAGDAVLTFAPEVVADPEAYAAAMRLPEALDPTPTSDPDHPARRRRDNAIAGFLRLCEAYESGDSKPLEDFHVHAGALIQPKTSTWRERWADGPQAASEQTGQVLSALAAGQVDHLRGADIHRGEAAPKVGMCGWLSAY
jgi:hypothetical protein